MNSAVESVKNMQCYLHWGRSNYYSCNWTNPIEAYAAFDEKTFVGKRAFG